MNLESILLGLIYLHPSVSGYELKSIIKNSTGYFFNASLSQIYPALKSLALRGAITFEVEPLVGKQDRKVYTITEDGKKELISWLSSPLKLEESLNAFQVFLLRLTFMGILENQKILDFLNEGLQFCLDEREKVRINNLNKEKAYIQADPEINQRYLFLWHEEYEFLEKDLDRKIEFVENLIKKISQLS